MKKVKQLFLTMNNGRQHRTIVPHTIATQKDKLQYCAGFHPKGLIKCGEAEGNPGVCSLVVTWETEQYYHSIWSLCSVTACEFDGGIFVSLHVLHIYWLITVMVAMIQDNLWLFGCQRTGLLERKRLPELCRNKWRLHSKEKKNFVWWKSKLFY